jgi:glycosyltransferase involved in cell wall biosynthesis
MSGAADPWLSVVLPCRDQADHIRAVLRGHAEALRELGRPFEILAVENASRDATRAEAEAAAGELAGVRVLQNPEGGWGRSVLAGLRAARGAVLCYANSARTRPEQLVAVVRLHQAAAPCLAKVRRVERGATLRQAGSWLYNLEARLLFGVRTSDVNGTPKVIDRATWERADLREVGDLIDLELLARARRLGVPVVELTVEGFSRYGGRSRTGFGSGWRMYRGALSLWRRLRSAA